MKKTTLSLVLLLGSLGLAHAAAEQTVPAPDAKKKAEVPAPKGAKKDGSPETAKVAPAAENLKECQAGDVNTLEDIFRETATASAATPASQPSTAAAVVWRKAK